MHKTWFSFGITSILYTVQIFVVKTLPNWFIVAMYLDHFVVLQCSLFYCALCHYGCLRIVTEHFDYIIYNKEWFRLQIFVIEEKFSNHITIFFIQDGTIIWIGMIKHKYIVEHIGTRMV